MKRFMLFGWVTRLAFIVSFLFISYAMIDIYIISGYALKYLLLALVVIIFVIIGSVWIHSIGVFMDINNNKLKIQFGITTKNKHERKLSDISSLDIENDLNIGVNFIINYNSGAIEKIYYKFYRISFLEQIQFNALRKKLMKYFSQKNGL